MNRRPLWCAGVVVALALLAMVRCASNDFVKWDDPQTITDNPALHPPTLENVWSFWISPAAGLYVPLTYTVWSILARFTTAPWAFHLASVLAHAIAAFLCFRILRRLVESNLAAMFGALIFAVHPLQVEPVAWASGLKDVLAGLFALAAIDRHLVERRSAKSIIFATTPFALAMLSKPSAASAIAIALAIDLLILRRPINKSLLALIPWLAIAPPLLFVARQVQDTSWIAAVDWWKRPLIAADALQFYLTKLVAPIHLCIDYGRFPAAALASSSIRWTWIIPTIVVIAVALIRNRTLICASAIFLSGLIWNLGLAPFQFQLHSTVADHYMYLAMLGPALAIAWIITLRPREATPIVALCIVCLTALSVRQIGFWKNSVTLFEHTLSINDNSEATHLNLGRVLGEADDLAGAERHFRRAIEINPRVPEAYRNLAVIAVRQQNVEMAIANLTEAVRLWDESGQNPAADRSELVKMLVAENRWREVADQLARAAAADPNNPKIAQMLRVARQRAATEPSP